MRRTADTVTAPYVPATGEPAKRAAVLVTASVANAVLPASTDDAGNCTVVRTLTLPATMSVMVTCNAIY